ncbi:MAG: DUF3419 family protein [Pseudomonadota bacterium]
MSDSKGIAGRADFDQIRYAQAWEDADVLTRAMGDMSGKRLVSICASGDNSLALLMLDPSEVVALDISQAQIECLNLRLGAYRTLNHPEFLELMGARSSERRSDLLDRALAISGDQTKSFWEEQRAAVRQYGAGGIGKFERYFRLFRRYILPLCHTARTVDEVFHPRAREGREHFFKARFNNWRWRFLMRVFFSRFVMARLGRDPAFFDHVDGSVTDHVARRIVHAAVSNDPADNPYLHWILKGHHNRALPMAWRVEHFAAIRDRLERIQISRRSIEEHLDSGSLADGYNLSDIFEYMAPDAFASLYGGIVDAARPGARLVYWNMMAPRRAPPSFAQRVRTLNALEAELKAIDKAFFYSDLIVEEVH